MIAEVVVDISNDFVDRVYDYIALDDTVVGSRVKVPFANRLVLGYVIRIKDTTDYDKTKLKTIKQNIDKEPIIKNELAQNKDSFYNVLYPQLYYINGANHNFCLNWITISQGPTNTFPSS